MNDVRIHGDPFADSGAASQLRSFLRVAVASGVRCALSLSGVPAREPAAGERERERIETGLIALSRRLRTYACKRMETSGLLCKGSSEEEKKKAEKVHFVSRPRDQCIRLEIERGAK